MKCIEIIEHRNENNDYYNETAELLLGFKKSNKPFEFEKCENTKFSRLKENRTHEEQINDSKIINLALKLEHDEWNELWDIIKTDAQTLWD